MESGGKIQDKKKGVTNPYYHCLRRSHHTHTPMSCELQQDRLQVLLFLCSPPAETPKPLLPTPAFTNDIVSPESPIGLAFSLLVCSQVRLVIKDPSS